jgi:two-component system phosphate regulon response regulator PhoB
MEADTSKSTILIADDDADILELLETVLTRGGYGTIPAADGEEALRLARERLPRACILDVVMPGLDGLEVLRALRGDTATAEIPVLMLSASVQNPDVEAALKAGANDYLTKPFSYTELLERLTRVLNGA